MGFGRQWVISWLWGISLAAYVSSVDAAPKAELWEVWTAYDPAAETSIDHSAWQRLLTTYVSTGADGVTRVAYGSVTETDRQALSEYLTNLQSLPISRYGRDEQLAYWINLYNALTLNVVLSHYPVERILDIKLSPGFFSFGPWDKKLVEVEGKQVSLNDIEHRILRPVWRDPRIHYAVNCASVGCPNLHPVPFSGSDVDTQLTEAAKAYVNHQRGVQFEGERLVVSSIYHWYRADFGNSDADIIRHLQRYAAPQLAARLAEAEQIDDHRYDWRLNDAAVLSRSQ